MKKNRRIWIYPILLIASLLILSSSCKKDENDNPSQSDTVIDIDGNVYHSVTIGSQVWMVENLKVTKFNDGTNIPNVTGALAWSNLVTPGYCYYNNDAANKNKYGNLYNWYAVNTGKLCPTGWRVPTDADWTTLTNYLGGENIVGSKLKEKGTSNWWSPNAEATNETGFTGLPGGNRAINGSFGFTGIYGFWWSTSEINNTDVWGRSLCYFNIAVTKSLEPKGTGQSIRCIKN